ncbi:MAG: PAS domain S-box protein [Pirellulaceae bacterium]
MSAIQPDPQMSESSTRRVYFALAAAVVVLTCALLGILQFQPFDSLFRDGMTSASGVPTSSSTIVREDARRFALRQALLIASALALVSLLAVTLHQYIRFRRRVEAALRESQEKLRTISEAALDAVIMMDASGRTEHWNPAAQHMFGYSAEEVLGKDIHRLLTPVRYREEVAAAIRSFLVNGQGRAVGKTLELQALRKNGEEFPIEISLAPIRVDDQWNAVAVVRDITARRQVEQALSDRQRSLLRLLKSHDQERKLIAYEIHDGLAQQLVAALYQCQAAERSIPEISNDAVATFRELEQALRGAIP